MDSVVSVTGSSLTVDVTVVYACTVVEHPWGLSNRLLDKLQVMVNAQALRAVREFLTSKDTPRQVSATKSAEFTRCESSRAVPFQTAVKASLALTAAAVTSARSGCKLSTFNGICAGELTEPDAVSPSKEATVHIHLHAESLQEALTLEN